MVFNVRNWCTVESCYAAVTFCSYELVLLHVLSNCKHNCYECISNETVATIEWPKCSDGFFSQQQIQL